MIRRARWTGPLLTIAALLVLTGACHRTLRTTPDAPVTLARPSRMYAALLGELRREGGTASVVIDSLLPTDGLDADVAEGLVASLGITRADVAALLAAQRRGGARVDGAMLPDSTWRTVSVRALDSLRTLARAQPRDPRSDPFWARWNAAFPNSAGYVILSPAAFSTDGTEAIVHVRVACGATCGTSEVRVLRRDPRGQWHTARRVPISIS